MKSKCECGQQLNFKISPFETNEKRVCLNCGKINYEDKAPIDWSRVVKERDYEDNSKKDRIIN